MLSARQFQGTDVDANNCGLTINAMAKTPGRYWWQNSEGVDERVPVGTTLWIDTRGCVVAINNPDPEVLHAEEG